MNNENAKVVEIDSKPKTKTVKVRLNIEQLGTFIEIWQRHAKASTLDACVEEMQLHWELMSNQAASSQAATLRKNGVPMLNFRKAKMDYSSLAELAKQYAE